MKRIVLYVVGGFLIAALAAGVVVVSNLDAAIKMIVQTVGARATGTDVTLETARVSLRSGTVHITGLIVGNPKGYKTASAFELGDINVTLDVWSLWKNPVVIHQIVIDSVGTTYEVAGHGSNIGAIRANVAAFADSLAGVVSGSEGKGGEKRFIIDDLYVHGGHVAMSATFMGGRAAGRTFPDIHLHDIGRDKGGATSAEVSAELAAALTGGVIKSVADLGIDAVNDGFHAVKDAGGSIFARAKTLFHK